jgi:formylglycine-generating enzyme required for sulfatase activity
MVHVPAGTFMMGSEDGDSNEAPLHEMYLDTFWIDRTEVTNAQFASFVDDTGYVTTAEQEGTAGQSQAQEDNTFKR